jgi:hypothetical protein
MRQTIVRDKPCFDKAASLTSEIGRTLMSGYPSKLTVSITDDQKAELERWQRCNNFPQGKCRRARIILLRAVNTPILAIAKITGVRHETVRKWITRFCEDDIDGLDDRARSGRPPVFSPCGRDGVGSNRM